jgi:hypothetical protein
MSESPLIADMFLILHVLAAIAMEKAFSDARQHFENEPEK